jgi:hypothetical protein
MGIELRERRECCDSFGGEKRGKRDRESAE